MVYIFYFHRKILKDKDLTFTCRNEKAERTSPFCLNASKCSMNIKLTSNKCRRKLDTQRTRNAEKT